MKEKLRIVRRGNKYALQIKKWYFLRWKCMMATEEGEPYIFSIDKNGWFDNLVIPQESLDNYLTWKKQEEESKQKIQIIKEIKV